MKPLIGADPELWIYDNKQQKIISAEGLFPGTKDSPYPVTHGAVQVDGMAAEFNINPASNYEEFLRNILSVLWDLHRLIKERNPDLDFEFVFTPVAYFGAEYIQAQPPHAKELGCNPDFNAYLDGEANPTPDADTPYRTASGHIHVGWGEDLDIHDKEHIEACCMMVKQLDIYLGSRVVEVENEDGKVRRDLYGKAGAFRPKKYGVEYRTPSNIWLSDTNYISTVYYSTLNAFNDLISGHRAYEFGTAQTQINMGIKPHTNADERLGISRKDTIINVDSIRRLLSYAELQLAEERDWDIDDLDMWDPELDEPDFDEF